MRKIIFTGAAFCGEIAMTPFVPLEAATGIGGAVFATFVALYMPEFRAAARWVFRSRQRRDEEIARLVDEKVQERERADKHQQMKRLAEAIAQLYRPKKALPATEDDERSQ